MNIDKIKKALPKPYSSGRPNIIYNRPDVGNIVVDIVLRRRTQQSIADRYGYDLSTVQRFKKQFVTDLVIKTVLAEEQLETHDELNQTINKGQDDIQQGLRSIVKEQKELYKMMKEKIGDGRDIEDVVPALGQLLRDQGQSFDRLLKSYTALKEKTTITLSINESPEWAVLQDVLYAVFEQHPEAFAAFLALSKERKLALE